MGQSVIKTSTTINIDEKHRKLSNMIILATCDAIIEMGGFDKFFENLNMSVLSEYSDAMFPNIRKYMVEKEKMKCAEEKN